MWFGILTPGAHPSRRTPTAEATVFAWTPADRRRIDGPLAVVHGGLRVVRRQFYDERLAASRPRCFVCLAACPVPDPDALEAPQAPEDDDAAHGVDGGQDGRPGPRPARPEELDAHSPALFAYVHLADLHGPVDTPLDEEALILFPEAKLALATPLDAVPTALALVASSAFAPAPSACEACGCFLPGDIRTRDAYEAREGLQPRAGRLPRARTRRGGGHGWRRAA